MPALVLVPSALRATRASRRLCDAEGGVLFGPRVATLAQVAPGLLAAAGDPRAILTPLAERLLAVDAARECAFGRADLDVSDGVARAISSALSELRQAEVPVAALEDAARATSSRTAAADRLSTCARMLRAYEGRLEGLRALDRAGALGAAAAALQRGVASEEVRRLDLLVLEGFTAMSPVEWRLVEALVARARRTHVRLPFFPERPDLSAPEPLLRRLEALHDGRSHGSVEARLERIDGERSGRVAAALLAIAGGPGGNGARRDDTRSGGARGDQADLPVGEVSAEAGCGEEGEAEVAAAFAARWIDAGLAPDDVLVFAPSPSAVAAQLARAFAERGVPLARGAGDPLSENPAIRAVRRALGAAASGLDRASAEELLASTYVAGALPPPRVRELLDRAGALDGRLDPEDALRRRAAGLGRRVREREQLLRGAEAIADLKARVAALRGDARPRQHAARLRGFVEAGVRRRAARADPVLARRDLAALNRLDDCAEAVVAALAMTGRGVAALSAAEWLSLLDVAVEGAAIPAGDAAAGAVELWAVSDAPGLSARAAIVTGCTRGAFPAPPPRAGLLRDAERAAVNAALGRAALPPSGADRAAALHEAFCALAAARESLALTWAAPAGGRAGGPPAPLVSEVLAADGQRVEMDPRPAPSLSRASSEREALEAAARLAATGAAPAARAALAAASPALAERLDRAVARGDVEREREEATGARAASPYAGAVAPGPLLDSALPTEWSPSQLETDARCPFRFFLETPCRLAVPDEAILDVTPRDEGRLLHVVLERFVAARLRRGATAIVDDEAARAELRTVVEQVFRELEPSGKLGDAALWSSRRELVASRLERVLASEARISAEDGLQPRLLEHAFGGEGGAPPLVFSDGQREVRLCGRVDRIDASADTVRVLDWKSGRASAGSWREKVDPDSFGVTSFQLPAYLIAAARALPGRSSLEAGYVFLRSASRSGLFATDAADPSLSVDPAERERVRDGGGRAFADAVLDVVGRARAGEFPIAPRDCGGCAFGAVCRSEGSEEEDA